MSNLCQNQSVSKNKPLTCIIQEICGQKTNLYANLWKILTFFVEITMIFMKIRKFSLAMHHGKC